MSPRTGRPKVDNPKDKQFGIRLDSETVARMTEYCAKHGITKGEAIRRGLHLLFGNERK